MKRILTLLLFSMAALAQSHGLLIAWTPGTCPVGQTCGTAVNFNVMRSTVSGGPYSQIAQTTANITNFVDSTGTPGQKYFYVIQAVATGAPVASSPEGSGTFPFPPAPAPSSPTVTPQ